MNTNHHQILDAEAIAASSRRIAFQIYEANLDEQKIVVFGIAHKGMAFAQKLVDDLHAISILKVQLAALTLDKNNPKDTLQASVPLAQIANQSVVVVDDVLNTGKTLMYAVNYILQVPVKQIKTAVLVNRNHKKYPIKGDFKGISLSTSHKEHIEVIFEGTKEGAYLS